MDSVRDGMQGADLPVELLDRKLDRLLGGTRRRRWSAAVGQQTAAASSPCE